MIIVSLRFVSGWTVKCSVPDDSSLNLLGQLSQPLKYTVETIRLFDFWITRQIACPHQHERTACHVSVHAVSQFVSFAPYRLTVEDTPAGTSPPLAS